MVIEFVCIYDQNASSVNTMRIIDQDDRLQQEIDKNEEDMQLDKVTDYSRS